MRRLLLLVSAGEAATGLTLLAAPSLVVRLLFGAEVAGAGVAMSRLAGIALIARGTACWPWRGIDGDGGTAPMLIYSALVTAYLGILGSAPGRSSARYSGRWWRCTEF